MRTLAASLAVAAAIPVVAAAAAPAPGGLTYAPSAELAKLTGRVAVRTSPDGRHLYFLGGVDARTSLAIVQRDPKTGKLSRAPGHDMCLITWIAGQKICRSSPAFNNSIALAVAPDDGSVAVGGHRVHQLAVFRPTPGGGLKLASCLGVDNGGFPCKPARGLANTATLEFSPDGRTLYAGETERQALLVLSRNPATGALRELPGVAGCVEASEPSPPESPPCTTVPAAYFRPHVVRVLPHGRTVLVVSDADKDDGLFVFRRDPASGALTFLSCYTRLAEPPCGPSVAPRAEDVAVGTDPRTVYAVSGRPTWGRADVLRIDPGSGEVTRAACYGPATGGCTKLAVPDGGQSAVLSPDGRTLYVGGFFAIRAFRVDGTRLEPVPGKIGCFPSAAACARLPRVRFDGYRSLAMTPDARELFVAGYAGLAFRIAPRPATR